MLDSSKIWKIRYRELRRKLLAALKRCEEEIQRNSDSAKRAVDFWKRERENPEVRYTETYILQCLNSAMRTYLSWLNIEAAYKFIRTNGDCEYLTVSADDPNRVSYALKKEDKYNHKARRFTTLGKWIKRNFDVDDNVLKTFVNLVTPKLFAFTHQILEGYEIVEAFRNEEGTGSCMAGKEFCEMYSSAPVKMLIITQGNTYIRRLVWEAKQSQTGELCICLDRVYTNIDLEKATKIADDLCRKLFKGEKRIVFREHNRAVECPYGNEDFTCEFRYRGDVFPYVDSFAYLTRLSNGKIRLTTESDNGTRLDSTEGNIPSCCEACGCDLEEDESYDDDGETLCSDCYHERYFHCEHCSEDCPIDDMNQVTINGRYRSTECWCDYCAQEDAVLYDDEYWDERSCEKVYYSADDFTMIPNPVAESGCYDDDKEQYCTEEEFNRRKEEALNKVAD